MNIPLTSEEQEFLLQALRSYLSDLRAEISRTDNRQFKAKLKHHEKIAQGIIEKLGSA
jgi:hypothetical protein